MKEEDIRKRNVFNQYLDIAKEDIDIFFGNPSGFNRIKCPACKGDKFKPEFKKLGFQYVSCLDCNTLFVNPRPSFSELNKFYTSSLSTKFWINESPNCSG